MHPYIAVPAILMLVYRAWSRKSLTPAGILTAFCTAVVHALHPWPVFFALLAVFFLGGTAVTKVKHDVKARLTLSSTGASGGEGPRSHVQVLANSAVASVLILLHCWQSYKRKGDVGDVGIDCWAFRGDLLVIGIISNYAAVAADTYSSELGILSKSQPRLITSWNLRAVPPGTNGGVSLTGIMAGFFGAFTIAMTSAFLLPFCPTGSTSSIGIFPGEAKPGLQGGSRWAWRERILFTVGITIWGGLGSLLDSFLGGWLQASVIETRTGRIIEGSGGKKVPVHSPKSRNIISGLGLLDNNDINLLMAVTMSIGGMVVASFLWDKPLSSVLYERL